MRQGTSAGDITNKRNCRTIFADYVRQRESAQLGLRSPVQIQGFVNPATAYQTAIEGATYTTSDEYNSYIAEVSVPVPISVVTVPDAPTGVTGISGNQQVEISFIPPVNNGGSAITSYTVTASPGGATATGSSSPLTVTGLTNGTSYTFTVVAINSIGNSLPSSASLGITPSTVPSAPSIFSAVPGNGQAIIGFDQPSDGGSAITNYQYSINNGLSYTAFSPAQTSSPVTITGLANGTTYQIRLKAVNANGVSAQSFAFPVTPAGVPPAPTSLSGVAGDEAAYILFTQSSNGGSVITNYAYSLDDGDTWINFSPIQIRSPVIITGLTNSTPYNIKLRAINASGNGIASLPVTVTPAVGTLVGGPLITLDANAYSGSGITWANGITPGTLDASLISAPIYNTTDPSNTFFTFNGTNQIAQIAAAAAINPTVGSAITVLIWARINTATATNSDGLISKQFGASGDYDGYSLSLDTVNNRLFLNMNGSSVNGNYPSIANAYSNGWAFYTIVVRFGGGSANPSYIYVDPYRVAAANNNESGIPNPNAPLQFPRGIQDVGVNFCPADIGAIYYYNTALSQEQIITNYDATKSRYV